MFSKHHDELAHVDLSTDLSYEADWKVGSLRTFDITLNITTIAFEPIASLLALGTSDGNIHIFGKPGVNCKIALPQPEEVRFLEFASASFNLVCLDANNQLLVYSLLEFGKPKLLTAARFDQISAITLSPSHNHVFLATQNGDIKTYDLVCLRKSPYKIPNLWKLYEEKLSASGVPPLIQPTPSDGVQVVIHPRNLDFLFVAYAGGVILTNLTERSTVRAYELILSPGAPGGAGYGAPDILTHRRMMCTSIAVHPSGHFFAVGYADGSIAFWAAEDDNKPLLVRTLDSVDVNLVDAGQLDKNLSNLKGKGDTREPIFKLSWSGFSNSSDPRGGETVLTILGGLDASKPPGLTVFLLPAFNPTEPPPTSPVPQDTLHSFFRLAMCQSLSPVKTYFYETQQIVQDYLLLPKSTPHFSSCFDPYAILVITEHANMKTVKAYQHPPPTFKLRKEEQNLDIEGQDVEDHGHTSGLSSPSLQIFPERIRQKSLRVRTPFTLQSGESGALGGYLFTLDKDTYQYFSCKGTADNFPDLQLKGGQAYADIEKATELRLSKYQPLRILMTYNRDLTVQFYDMSAQLLIPSNSDPSLNHDIPESIPDLDIRLDELFSDPSVADILTTPVSQISIRSVHVASESLECAIVLESGEVVVYHQSSDRAKSPCSSVLDPEIYLLNHIPTPPGNRLVPFFMLSARKDPVATCAISNIGFLAVSYMDGVLLVIDMRIPNIILLHGTETKHRHSITQGHSPLHASSPDVIKSLTWTVCPLDTDPHFSVRLITGHQSGNGEIFTLAHSKSPASWSVVNLPVSCKVMQDPLHDAAFVLDGNSGAQLKADRAELAASLKSIDSPVESSRQPCIFVSVGAKGVKTSSNVNGEKIKKVEWGSKVGTLQSAQIVKHLESHALIVQTDKHEGLIYSLPFLELVTKVQLPAVSTMPFTIDTSGDFITWTPFRSGSMNAATYGTFFDMRRTYTPPDVDLSVTRGSIPTQPQPVSLGPASLLGSWFSFNQTKSGNQIDELLGGPDRPVPQKAKSDEQTSEGGITGTAASAASNLAANAAAVQSNLYSKLSSAMNERGQLLNDLGERFNSLEEGSRNMVAQAKRLAAQQTTKSWLGF